MSLSSQARPAAALALLLLAPAHALLAQQDSIVSSTGGTDPKISSDGTVVAYQIPYADWLTTARPDGTGKVVWGSAFTYQMDLSGDGRLLVFDLGGELWTLDLLTGQYTRIWSGDAFVPAVSDDGSKIAFATTNYFLHLIGIDGSNLQSLGVQGNQGGPSLTADGSVVVFEDFVPPDLNDLGVYRINANGTGLQQLSSEPGFQHLRARISGDGGTITYETYYYGAFHAVDGDGSNHRVLLSGLSGNFSGEGHDYSALSTDGRVGVYSPLEGTFAVATDGSWARQIHNRSGTVDISGTGDVVVLAANPGIHAIGVPGIPPGELMDMDISSDGQTLAWATRPSAYSHNLYRARWSSPGALSPAAAGDCLQGGIVGTTAADSNVPAPDEAFGYFVTGENAWGEGPSETTPQGVERVPAVSCPDADTDGDSYPDAVDVCPLLADPYQTDPDGDGLGSLCDNCPDVANADQFDFDHDGVGNACDP